MRRIPQHIQRTSKPSAPDFGKESGLGGKMSVCPSSPWSRSGCPMLGARLCRRANKPMARKGYPQPKRGRRSGTGAPRVCATWDAVSTLCSTSADEVNNGGKEEKVVPKKIVQEIFVYPASVCICYVLLTYSAPRRPHISHLVRLSPLSSPKPLQPRPGVHLRVDPRDRRNLRELRHEVVTVGILLKLRGDRRGDSPRARRR